MSHPSAQPPASRRSSSLRYNSDVRSPYIIWAPYSYRNHLEYLLTVIPEHMDDTNTDFCKDMLPWSDNLPDSCRKNNATKEWAALKMSMYPLWGVYVTEILNALENAHFICLWIKNSTKCGSLKTATSIPFLCYPNCWQRAFIRSILLCALFPNQSCKSIRL